MENAIWNDKVVIASDISKNYEQEKEIRIASGRKELRCPDPSCKNPLLKYCHGEIKNAYFAHLDNCKCDYADFDKENTSLMRELKLKIYDSFRLRGYNVQMDVKLLEHHYTHLLITLQDNTQIGIELGTQRMTASRMEYLTTEYKKKGIHIKWLVISNKQEPVKESETFFMKRYQMNESAKKDLLILNWNGTELAQHIEDTNEYLYKGRAIHLDNYPDFYCEYKNLESLVIEDGELSIEGFHKRYNEWLAKKENAFKKWVQNSELKEKEAELLRKKYEQEREKVLRQQRAKIQSKPKEHLNFQAEIEKQKKVEFDEKIGQGFIPNEVIIQMNQQNEQIHFGGHRWIKCKICGKIAPSSEFWTYGGFNEMNLGECNNCGRRKSVD